MASEPDYYALLQVAQDADLATIRLAFRRLARLYHPDVAGTGSLARMQQLNAAYRVLSDPDERRNYDMQRGFLATPVSAPGPHPSSPTATTTSRTGTVRHSSGPLHRLQILTAADVLPVAALSFAAGGTVLGVGLLDGTIQVWDTRTSRVIRTFSFNHGIHDGILQEVCLSPSGAIAIAWGFQLGIRSWDIRTGESLWYVGAYGPSGAMDARVFDSPAWLRLALPDAPLTLSEEDPFRWAHEGRLGSGILSRPLGGPVDPSWAVPARCPEVRQSKRPLPDPAQGQWRVQQRILASDGRALLTLSTGRTKSMPSARVLRVWELDHRTARGSVEPRCVSQIEQPLDYLQFPVAVTPDLRLACAGFQDRDLRVFSLRGGQAPSVRIAAGKASAEAQIVLAPDGRFVALADGARLDLFETLHGQRVQQWQMAAPITALAFVPYVQNSPLGIGLENGLTELWGV
jgi:WD40 repeat protein